MSDWYLSQLARQDQYGDTPPANWPEVYGGLTPDERGLQPQTQTIGPAEMRSYTPTLGERIKGGISDLFRMGGADPYNAGKMGDIATTGLSMFPPIGIPVAKSEMEHGVEARSPGGVVMGALGAIPGAKGVLGEIGKPFYSAAGRAVENAKLGKGTGEQWLGYLRNQPGVKPEELQYVFGNLPEGQLTKAQMQAHAAENAVTLGEVRKGGSALAPQEQQELNTLRQRMNVNELTAPEYRRIEDLEHREAYGMNNTTKYQQWQLPGGENYRETLLTLPGKESKVPDYRIVRHPSGEGYALRDQTGNYAVQEATARNPGTPLQWPDHARAVEGLSFHTHPARDTSNFRSSHWDEPNVLAHVRTNDREIPGVGKSLHVEEIQSDWHQKGRSQGYAGEAETRRSGLQNEWNKFVEAGRQDTPEGQAVLAELRTLRDVKDLVPDAPFKSTWADVALKRQIREASEKGYDAISWTPGKAQADRYKLSNQLKELQYLKNEDGTYEIAGTTISGDGFNHPGKVTADKLSDVVGKEMAQKIVNNEGKRTRGQNYNGGYFDGIQLDIGGEGMRGFYDKMLVDKANAIGKKHGARVEQSEVKTSGGKPTDYADYDAWVASKNQPVHVLRITPELRAAAMKGFPLFTAGGVVAGGTIGELARRDKYGRNE